MTDAQRIDRLEKVLGKILQWGGGLCESDRKTIRIMLATEPSPSLYPNDMSVRLPEKEEL